MTVAKAIVTWTLIAIGAMFAIFVGISLLGGFDPNAGSGTEAVVAASAPTVAGPVHAAEVAPLPADEQALIEAAAQGAADYAAGANDMAKGAARPKRAHAICAALRSLEVRNWRGTINTLSSNSDGKGVLAIRLSPNLTVTTWNNDFSDLNDHTLLDPASTVFAAASGMQEGAQVAFSGTFIRSDVDCIKEPSFTIGGSMEDPGFIIRFTDLRAGD